MASERSIERGWFYLADLNPRRGTEPGKTRPVLVVQSELLNRAGHPSTVVLPVTAKVIEETEPLRVRIPGGSPGFPQASDILIDQVRVIDNLRLYRPGSGRPIKRIAPAAPELMEKVMQCLRLLLDMP